MTSFMAVETRQFIPRFLQQGDLKLLLFGGKGGVGKTTCAAATALRLAQQSPERSFLIVSTDPAHSLRDSFVHPPSLPNLHLLEIDSRKCLQKFKEAHAAHLRQIALRGTFLDEEDVARLLDLSMPGMDEVMAFNEIAELVEGGEYSCIIVDTAATGHTLRLLELPGILRQWIEALDAMLAKHRYMARLYAGRYRKDDVDLFLETLSEEVERLSALLCNRLHCRFVPVMLAERLSVQETRRLVDRLQSLDIPVTDIVVNRIFPSRTDCPTCREVRSSQGVELRRLASEFSDYSLWRVPVQSAEVRGPEQLAGFWRGVRSLEETYLATDLGAMPRPRVERPSKLPRSDVSLLLFAGKGGVGKTTLASATALRLAQAYPGKRVLLFSTDPAHSLSDCLGMRVAPQETELCRGLTAMEINAEQEFEHLKTQYADEVENFFSSLTRGQVDLEFDRQVIERMMDLSPPGLDEVMALTRAVELMELGKHDIFVLDTAPTGHLLRLLELPALIQDWLRVFFGLLLKYKNLFRLPKISEFTVAVSKRVKVLRSLLADPKKGQLYAVSILTEMAFEETRDLLAACGEAEVHVPALFLNLATPRSDCSLCASLAQAESHIRARYERAFSKVPQSVVYRCGEVRGLDRLAELGQALYDG